MNLDRLLSEAGQRLRNQGISDAQLTIWANNAVEEIASRARFTHLFSDEEVTTEANLRTYYLRDIMHGQITLIVDETSEQEVYPKDERELIRMDLNRDDTGDPCYYSVTGVEQFERQLSSASTITVVSSDSGDTTQKVRIRGVVGGAEDYELLSLNGATNVTGTKSFTEIRGISKDAVTDGKVTVTDGTNTLAVIPRSRFSQEYQEFNLTPVPDAAYSLRVFGYRRPMDMVNDEDVPEIPESFHELILMGIQKRGHEYLYDFNRANELMAIMLQKEKDLVSRINNPSPNVRFVRGWIKDKGLTRLPGRLPPEYGY